MGACLDTCNHSPTHDYKNQKKYKLSIIYLITKLDVLDRFVQYIKFFGFPVYLMLVWSQPWSQRWFDFLTVYTLSLERINTSSYQLLSMEFLREPLALSLRHYYWRLYLFSCDP